jgi:hypothetical protein
MKFEADKLTKRKKNIPILCLNESGIGGETGAPINNSAVQVGDYVHLQVKDLPELRNAFLVKIITINDNDCVGKIIQRSIIPEKIIPPEQTKINFEKDNIMGLIR